jgi:hypothetical protein
MSSRVRRCPTSSEGSKTDVDGCPMRQFCFRRFVSQKDSEECSKTLDKMDDQAHDWCWVSKFGLGNIRFAKEAASLEL